MINPLLLAGLAALVVPVLVHLVQREDRSGLGFPSLMFVRQIPFRARRRRTFRDRALLALRCLALIASVLAFAAPYVANNANRVSEPAAERDVVILLDRSYSMGHRQRWQTAVRAVGERIDALTPGERVALVTFDDSARLVQGLTADRARLRTSLDAVAPGDGATRVAPAFALAARVLAEGGARQGGVVLISDLQRSGFAATDALVLDAAVQLEVIPIAGPIGPNAAVMDAQLEAGTDTAGNALAVRVRNTGDAALTGGRMALLVDGRASEQRKLELAVGEERTFRLPVVVARDRPTPVTVRVGPDELTADNRHHAVLVAGRRLTVAMIESSVRRAHQGVFLEEALRLSPSPGIALRRLASGTFSARDLDGVDVVILDDLAPPGDQSAQILAAFIAGGGGLLVVAGPATDGPWPAALADFLPGAVGPAVTPDEAGLSMVADMPDHPLSIRLGFAPDGSFSQVRVTVYRSLRPAATDRVIIRLNDGTPLLVERTSGSGRVLVLATTADPRWGTLAVEPGFVPLVHAMVDYLAHHTPAVGAFVLGDTVDLADYAGALPGATDWRPFLEGGGSAVIETPSGGERRLAAGHTLYTAPAIGIYQAHRAGGRSTTMPFAVNGERSESVLTALAPDTLAERLVRREASDAVMTAQTPRASATAGREHLGWWFLALAALLLALESLIANRLSLDRGAEAAPSANVSEASAA